MRVLTQDGLHILRLLADVKQRARGESIVQRIVQLAQVEKHLKHMVIQPA